MSNRLTQIPTRTGDDGTPGLGDGSRVGTGVGLGVGSADGSIDAIATSGVGVAGD